MVDMTGVDLKCSTEPNVRTLDAVLAALRVARQVAGSTCLSLVLYALCPQATQQVEEVGGNTERSPQKSLQHGGAQVGQELGVQCICLKDEMKGRLKARAGVGAGNSECRLPWTGWETH